MINLILNQLFPSKCPVCGSLSDKGQTRPLCSACWDSIQPYNGPCCNICGKPADSAQAGLCGECIAKPPNYERVFFYGLFEGTLKEAIHLFKYRSLRHLAYPLSQWVLNLPFPKDLDALVPVPLHRNRLLQREFNQSALIGRLLADHLNIYFYDFLLRRNHDNMPQSMMKGKERVKNVHNIFHVTGDIRGKRVLLFDDVITTGATANECARVLKHNGASHIYVVALARAFLK